MPKPGHERIEWLLEFLSKDIAFDDVGRVVTFTPLEMRHLCTDIEYCLLGPKAELNEEGKVMLTAPANSFEARVLLVSAHDVLILNDQVLARLHAALLTGMKTLEEGEEWRVAVGRVDWVLEQQPDGTVVRRYENAHIDAILLAAASDLVAEWWPQLRRCKQDECGNWFLPRHGSQRSHKAGCHKAGC